MVDRNFWITATVLFGIAVVLRGVRLDLMSFRFDQAAVAFRAMETFWSGLPLTGIVNSLGFHNGPGYVWTVLPSFMISPDPRWAVAWHGLLSATMVFPLAILGGRYRSDAVKWLPAILGAVLPVAVFAGRNLWAQYLLLPVTCWALLALDTVLDPQQSWQRRRRSAAAALGLLAWGVSIHFSAGILFVIAGGFVFVSLRQRKRDLAVAVLPAFILCLTLLPSGMDWYDNKVHPREKPDYAEEFEAILPDPLPWWARVPDSVGYSFANSSIESVWGVQTYMGRAAVRMIQSFDAFLLAATVLGGLLALLKLSRRQDPAGFDRNRSLATLLAAWLLIPAVVGGMLVQRVNAGYFLGSLPAGWLLLLFLPRLAEKFRVVGKLVILAILLIGLGTSVAFLGLISRHGYVPGSYYIPYGHQVEVVRYLASTGIPASRVTHLSGDWFQHSYDYIHRYVVPVSKPEAAKSTEFALMEDTNVRPDQPKRVSVFWALEPVEFGGVGVKLMPSRGAAETFTRNYYELPLE